MLDGYKTLIGAGVAFASELAHLFGVNLGDPAGLVNSIIAICGAALAIYGRIAATKRIAGGELQ